MCPAGAQPDPTNAEIIRVTARPGGSDTFTILRAQEGSTARSIQVGDQIAAVVTAKTLADIETSYGNVTTLLSAHAADTTDVHGIPDTSDLVLRSQALQQGLLPGLLLPFMPAGGSFTNGALTANRSYFYRVAVSKPLAVTTVAFNVGTLGADVAAQAAVYTYSGTTLTRQAVGASTTGVLNSTGRKTIPLSFTFQPGTVYYLGWWTDTGSTASVTSTSTSGGFFDIFGTTLGSQLAAYKNTTTLGTSITGGLTTGASFFPALAVY